MDRAMNRGMNGGMNGSMNGTYNMGQREMLRSIDAVSLALQDTVLFLDTHPTEKEALAYFDECSKMRNDLLAAYTMEYGPLLIDDVTMTDADYWNWINKPWPWENGGV